MAIEQLRNITYIGNISPVFLIHINYIELTESLQEPQDAQNTQDINQHKLSAAKLIHNNVQYVII